MSVVTGKGLEEFYSVDPETGWASAKVAHLQNKAQASIIIRQCKSDARVERLKSIGNFSVGAGASVLLGATALIVTKVATLTFALIAFPLAILPPLYSLVTTVAGLTVGTAFAYFTIKKYGNAYIEKAKNHWNHSNHLYAQAIVVELKKVTL